MEMSRKKKLFYILAIALSVIYLLWRIIFTIPWQAKPWVLAYALILWVCELVSAFTAYITIIFRLITKKDDARDATPPFLSGERDVPDVDVLIATHNEDVDLLKKTVNGAVLMEYPQGKKHIYICDDGNRPDVAALAKDFGVGYIGMENNREAKSGNLNHALAQLTSPLFVDFDADMIPFSNFLLETVPYFQKNWRDYQEDPGHTDKLGFVQTPQSFYEDDIFQFNLFSENIVANEQDFFSRDVNVLYGKHGYTIFTGSNALFLRQAVDHVGGFPTKTLTEDFELGARINIAGYHSYATKKRVSSGTTPLDLKGVIKQRSRWARGVIQSCRNLHIFLNPKISLAQRMVLANSYFYWWSFFRRLVYIFAPNLYALFKIQVVDTNFWLLMIMWAPGYFLLPTVLGDSSSKIRNERWGEVQETFFAPYLFIPVILQTLHIKAHKFSVTAKTYQRNYLDALYVLPHLILWLMTTIAIIVFNWGKWGSEILFGSVITFWLLMHWINLSFSLFIAMGRKVYRNETRFPRVVPAQIMGMPCETIDLSDSGISFQLADHAADLPLGENLAGCLLCDDLKIPFTSQLIRKIDDEGRYAGSIFVRGDEMPAYLHLVYDQPNRALPTENDQWITSFDILGMNLEKRLENLERRLRSFTTRD